MSKTDGMADEEERGGDSTLEVLSYVSQMSPEDGMWIELPPRVNLLTRFLSGQL